MCEEGERRRRNRIGTVSIWADEDDGMMGREIEMDAGDLLITVVRSYLTVQPALQCTNHVPS